MPPYSSPLGKTMLQLEQELLAVHKCYCLLNSCATFSNTVEFLADNKSSHYHLVAKEYIRREHLERAEQ